MIRKISAVIIAVSALVLSSCTKDTYIVGNDIQTVLITVNKDNWQYSNTDNNNYFYATVKMPEITAAVYTNGLVKMYRTYDFSSSNGAQIELPYVRHNEAYVSNGDYWVFYTETVDYEFGVGTMTIYYTASDFDYELDQTFVPDAMQFRCVIMR